MAAPTAERGEGGDKSAPLLSISPHGTTESSTFWWQSRNCRRSSGTMMGVNVIRTADAAGGSGEVPNLGPFKPIDVS